MNELIEIVARRTITRALVPWDFMLKWWYRKWWKRTFIILGDAITFFVDVLRIVAYKLTKISSVYIFLVYVSLLLDPSLYVSPDIKYSISNEWKMVREWKKIKIKKK